MGQMRVMRVPDFKKNGKTAFVRNFINKPLEPVAEKIYDLLLQMYKEKYGYFVLEPHFKNLYQELLNFASLLEYVKDVHNNKWLAEKYDLSAPETLVNLRKGVDQAFVQEISALNLAADKIYFSTVTRKDLVQISDKWDDLLSLLPSTHTVEYDDNEVITDQYLVDVEAILLTISEGINVLANQAREVYATSIIQFVKESNIPPSNALYRDIYNCLVIADLISPEQRHLHDASTSRYVRENYIKAKYQRL